MKKLIMIAAIVAVFGFASAQATLFSQTLPVDGSQHQGLHNNDGNAGNDQIYTANDFFTVIAFDVSAAAGQTALGDGTFHFQHFQTNRNVTSPMQIWQMNNFNADVDLVTASPTSRGPGAWLDNGGVAMSDLQEDRVGEVSTGMIGSVEVPGGIASLTWWSITVPQASIQAWLDGTAPAIMSFVDDLGNSNSYSRWDDAQNGGDPANNPRLEFEYGEGGGDPVVPEPAGLGLVGLALLAVRRRRS